MTLSRRRSLLVAVPVVVVAVAVVAWWQPWHTQATPPSGDPDFPVVDMPPIPVHPDSEKPYRPYQYQLTTNQSIREFEDRVRADPIVPNLTLLGGLYIRKAKESGDHAAYAKAEDAFQRALKAKPSYAPARTGLAIAACGRHRFAEGLRVAEEVYKEDPSSLDVLTVIADAHLELGNYPEAEAAIGTLEQKGGSPTPPAFLARLARLAELKGDPDRAVALLRQAADAQVPGGGFKEAQAWYPMRLGEVLLSQGKLDEAAAQLEVALKGHPNSPAALALLGRVRAAQGRHAEAISLCEKAARITPDLATLVFLGDLRARAGDAIPAKVFFDEVEKADKDPVGTRDLVLYYCDHDRKLPRALELAQAEARARKDVYTCDALAWALLKNGKPAEAERAMADALRLGTKDAVLLYHAGVIARAAGKLEQAQNFLRRALAVNPYFSESQAREAARLLGP
jgi:tetratricopeptide (TPR) repeat protein